MGLLDRILSFFGRSDSSGDERTGDSSVTVEREPRAAADAASEAAVKEPVPDEASAPDAEAETTAAESGRETTAEGDTETDEATGREPATETDADAAADSASEADAGSETESAAESEAAAESEPESEAAAESEPETTTDLQQVKGIGPAYASRLEETGIDSAEKLAGADPESVAEQIGVSTKQTERWIARAKDL